MCTWRGVSVSLFYVPALMLGLQVHTAGLGKHSLANHRTAPADFPFSQVTASLSWAHLILRRRLSLFRTLDRSRLPLQVSGTHLPKLPRLQGSLGPFSAGHWKVGNNGNGCQLLPRDADSPRCGWGHTQHFCRENIALYYFAIIFCGCPHVCGGDREQVRWLPLQLQLSMGN